MPDEKKDVITESSAVKPEGNPSGEGKSRVMPDGRTVEDVWAESQRKQSQIEKLEAEISAIKEAQEAAEAESSEAESPDDEESEIRAAADKLRKQKQTRPWLRVAEETMTAAMVDREVLLGNEYLEDRASETGKNIKDLAKELAPYAIKYQDKRPQRRNELAFRDWKSSLAREEEIAKKEARLKELEDREKSFREGAGRMVREPLKSEAFEKADKSKRLEMAVDLIPTGRAV